MQTPPYTPEKPDERLKNRSRSRSQGLNRPRASSIISNASSEDGAVFLGKAPPRALTPRPQKRRPEPIQDTQQSLTTFEEDTTPQSPMERLVIWIERQWTQGDENEFLRQLVLLLFIALIFVVVRNSNVECPPAVVIRGDVGDPAWSAVHHNPWSMMDRDANDVVRTPATALGADIGDPSWTSAQESTPNIPSNTNVATSDSGTSAFAIWNFAALANALPDSLQPSKLKDAAKSFLHPLTIASSAGSFLRSKAIGKMFSGATSAITPVREPDIHGWDVVVANQERRQHLLSVLGDMEEVSSHLHVELSSQLFEKSAHNTNAEQISAIERLEELQTQLEELKTHQYEVVRILRTYHKASTLASTALDDYTLAGRSSTSTKDLESLRSSMLDTGSQLLTHLNAAQENIACITRAAEDLPWKTQKDKWWLARWLNQYRYRSIVAAFSGLEHLKIYVDVVCGMVTSDMQALQ
ncbi:hypothetical protein KCU71_g12664, partial [Aureobasidium melanogenum]